MSDIKKTDHGEFKEGGPHNYVAEVLDNDENVASATDMTGLMPTPEFTEAAAESYSDLMPVPKQVNKINKIKKVTD